MIIDRKEQRFWYRANYNLSNYDYLVEESKIDAMLKYCKDHGIKNDGGYVFADCFRVVCRTNKVHGEIIKKLLAFA